MFKNCSECGGITSKYAAETYVCLNPGCRHIDAEQLYKMLKNIGLSDSVIKNVQANVVANAL